MLPGTFQLIAHRGASAEAPENTAAAFRIAQQTGATDVELDVRLSRDGHLIVFHDKFLHPKIARDGRAEDYPLHELERMDIGAWFDSVGRVAMYREGSGWTQPPSALSFRGELLLSFGAYLDTFGLAFHHHIELKGSETDIADRVLRAILAAGIHDRCTLSSYHLEHIVRTRRLDASIALVWLSGRAHEQFESAAAIPAALEAGANGMGIAVNRLEPNVVRLFRAAGLSIRGTHVHTVADLRFAHAGGSDGVTVNWIRQALSLDLSAQSD